MEFVLVPIAVFALIAIHEMGHYAAGLTAGIPAQVMRIRLLTFPQHGHAFGETSGLWEISKLPALVVKAFMLAIRLVLVWCVTR